MLYTLWDNDIEAESYFLDALEAIRTFEVKEHIKEGIVLESLAKLYGIRGEDKKAIEYYIFAADIYKNYGNHAKYAEIYTKIAMIYIDFIQDHKNAIESYEVALEIYENLNYDRESALILTTLGDIYSKEQVINEATSYFERALAYFQDLGDNENIILLQEKLRNLDYK